MGRVLALIHTVRAAMNSTEVLAEQILGPDIKRVHILDEFLLHDLLTHRAITPFICRHIVHHVVEAEELGASTVLITCSSIAPCVETAAPTVRIPVHRIDEAMVNKALGLGRRVGILATIDLALDAVYELTRHTAGCTGAVVEIEPVLCPPEAYTAMLSGKREEHDLIVFNELRCLTARCDVVMLAQGSMESVLERCGCAGLNAPVLSGPRLALEKLKQELTSAPERQ